MGSEQDF
jgi:hypothetical protein